MKSPIVSEIPFNPREWYLVPLPVIDEAVERIRDLSIVDYEYEILRRPP